MDRRIMLGALGLGALGLGRHLAACSSSRTQQPGAQSGGAARGPAAPSSRIEATEAGCVLTPSQAEGPYFVDTGLMRSDIREGKPGAPLEVELRVLRADGCSPLAGAFVEAWHADAAGNYSGFGEEASGTHAGAQRFLRGFQQTDADGRVRFQTIYPGWYPGRAPHVHLMVRAGEGSLLTTQLYFPEAVNETVYATAPYAARRSRRTTNAEDGADQDALIGKVSPRGEGYESVFRLVVPT
jgi:protocatechuate 3,4-dioxygenase beta subunit